MIVRDNDDTIAAALSGIRPWVDEIVVVDTGSIDRTPEICREHGARLFHFPWCDDFSAARNESLRHARGEWIFWLDSDDVIDADNGKKLRRLVSNKPAEQIGGFIFQTRYPVLLNSPRDRFTLVDQVRLFRNHPQIRFRGRVHEQVLPAVLELGQTVEWTDVTVVHAPQDRSAAAEQSKIERDLRLLNLELRECPENPLAWLHFANTFAAAGDHQQAAAAARDCIRRAKTGSVESRSAHGLLVRSLLALGDLTNAEEACRCGLEQFRDDPELLFLEGTLAQRSGDSERAERAFLDALSVTPQPYFRSLDEGIRGYKSRHNLAVIYAAQSRFAEAETQWRLAIKDRPDLRDAWQGLGEVLFRQQRFEELADLAERAVLTPGISVDGLLWQGRMAARQGKRQDAEQIFERAVIISNGDTNAVELWCRLLAGERRLTKAQSALQTWKSRAPNDVHPRNWLARALLETGECEDAIKELEELLRLQPELDTARQFLNKTLAMMSRNNSTTVFRDAAKNSQSQQNTEIEVLENSTR